MNIIWFIVICIIIFLTLFEDHWGLVWIFCRWLESKDKIWKFLEKVERSKCFKKYLKWMEGG